ncbi:hypothetical protein [Delftia acidovorans]|uniref:Uncharacterized protein n=1 Tax=Delftia acidovorans TaxID=80866 RepID=A0AAJ2R8Y2_DELAC|nr:hypothetical protein [Delftia acidovorans]MDX4954708.1 hypothetical protein [Delftia acidovorans]MDX4957363.1 hypothetical protein [Delftia acidovorans]
MSQVQFATSANSAIAPFGLLAAQRGEFLQLQVLSSNGDFYLGTQSDEHGPFTRESDESWKSERQAISAWNSGMWTQL